MRKFKQGLITTHPLDCLKLKMTDTKCLKEYGATGTHRDCCKHGNCSAIVAGWTLNVYWAYIAAQHQGTVKKIFENCFSMDSYMSALYIIARKWKQTSCPPTDVVYPYNGNLEYRTNGLQHNVKWSKRLIDSYKFQFIWNA